MSRILRLTFCAMMLMACQPTFPTPSINTFYVFRLSPPALIELSEDFESLQQIPVSLPPDCGLVDIFPPPRGSLLAVELSCSFGQSVLFLDPESGFVSQAFPQTDSHFLAWTSDGRGLFLKVDSAGNTRIVRVLATGLDTSGEHGLLDPPLSASAIPITELTYDLAPKPTGRDFTFTFSRGLGFGSELWLAQKDGRIVEQLYADPFNYISFARWSPDGKQIAFVKIPDSQTPFTVGELWLMDSDGGNARKLADADAGHGYVANWSPDETRLAFVVRENAEDPPANESVEALISNIYVIDTASNEIKQVTHLTAGRAETPVWSPAGNTLYFQSVVNGRMDVQVADLDSGEIQSVLAEPACCPTWMRK